MFVDTPPVVESLPVEFHYPPKLLAQMLELKPIGSVRSALNLCDLREQ